MREKGEIVKVARKEIEGRDREMRKLGEKLGGKEGNREERKAHIVIGV